MINLNNIFDSFKDKEDIQQTNSPQEQTLVDFLEKFVYLKLKTLVKLFDKYNEYKKYMYHNFIGEFGKDLLDEKHESISKASKFLFYNKGWDLIRNIDLEDKNFINQIQYGLKDNEELDKLFVILDKMTNYFVEFEEYEKCDFLSKLKYVINHNIKKS